MFSLYQMRVKWSLPYIPFVEWISHSFSKHQNDVDMEYMPESWQRDVGLLDGRDRRGGSDEGAFRAARMIYTQRSL